MNQRYRIVANDMSEPMPAEQRLVEFFARAKLLYRLAIDDLRLHLVALVGAALLSCCIFSIHTIDQAFLSGTLTIEQFILLAILTTIIGLLVWFGSLAYLSLPMTRCLQPR